MPYNAKDTAKYRAKKEAESKAARGAVGGGAPGVDSRKVKVNNPYCKICGPGRTMISALHMKDHFEAKHPREPFDYEAMQAVYVQAREEAGLFKLKELGRTV